MKECDKKVWNNIQKSRLNQFVARPKILPCAETIKIMIKQEDFENKWILDNKVHSKASFQPSKIELWYTFLEALQNIDEKWYHSSTNKINKLDLIKNWCSESKRIRPTSSWSLQD